MSDQKKSFGPPPPPPSSLKYVCGAPGTAILSWPIVRGLSSYTVQTHVRLDVAQPRSRGSLLLVMSQKGEPLGLVKLEVACVASVSARVHRERRDERKKKGMTGEGEGKEGTNFRAITRLETPRRLNWRSLKWDCRLIESNNREVRRYLFKANFLLTVLTQEQP